jgi:drug/metabolite transporter (DMT)-like permease
MEHWIMLWWYMIPAGLYALTDVMTYINLRTFDPATYYLLSEMKLVLTALVHQMLFQRRLNRWHWVALRMITIGCIIKMLDSLDGQRKEGDGSSAASTNPTWINYMILVLQVLASKVAGVYNEKLLKDKPSIPVNLQNICLYLDRILLLTVGLLSGYLEEAALAPSHVQMLFREPVIVAMACVMATAGIVTSRFLKAFDSVYKSIAAELVVVALPFLSWLSFGMSVTVNMVASIGCVVLGMYVYSSQPAPGTQGEKHYAPSYNGEEDGDTELFLPVLSSSSISGDDGTLSEISSDSDKTA